MKKTMIVLTIVIATFFIYGITDSVVLNFSSNYLKYNSDIYEEETEESLKVGSRADYYQYINQNVIDSPNKEVTTVNINDIEDIQGFDLEVLNNFEGKNNVILTGENGEITWSVNVDNPGYYNMFFEYFPIEGKSSSIERTIKINNEIPFESAKNISFPRIWGNDSKVEQDIFGNDIRPTQVEKPRWVEVYAKDPIGYVSGNFAFYFEEGINTFTLISEREPMVISNISLMPVQELKSYNDVLKEYKDKGYDKANEEMLKIEGEDSIYTTSPTLYPENSTDPATSPDNSPTKMKLNTIGGNNWGISGDSIAWNFKVQESGLYEITLKVKQNLATGMTSGRNVFINGKIPFKELQNFSFVHSNGWRNQTLGTSEEAFLFYFEKDVQYELRLEATLGVYGSRIANIESSINNLSRMYREIIRFTGPEPDPNRDYNLTSRIDNLIDVFEEELEKLISVREELIDISGSKSEKTGILDTIIFQLEDFIKSPSSIHKKIKSFSDNVSSLGTLVILLSSHPLEVDYIAIHSNKSELPKARLNIFSTMWYGLRSFFSTFTTDYSKIGMTIDDPNAERIEVWLTVGKDQSNILRKLIDEQFSSKEGILVDLKLVNAAALLPATLSGNGPDVALGVQYNVPVNYALRNASYDLTTFSSYDEIETRFHESAVVPFSWENGVYALPEQQTFLMMFYRKDIFEEYGLSVPETWDELISSVIDLQKYNLEFYLPVPVSVGAVSLPPNEIFSTMFYQNDGEFYINNNSESGFATGVGPEVFERWTEFYTDYSFPVQADFVNRFRSGQMPIGISHYNMYNTLSVFAPEIRGKWGFVKVPGTVVKDDEGNDLLDENGERIIRRDTVSNVTGSMMLKNTEHPEASWKFLDWWTSTETQIRFGREMEGILGAAARYPTANVEAMESLPWRTEEISILQEQWQFVRGVPEVPGSYMTGRHLDNAFRLVINDRANPRETIYDYVQVINEEMKKKREEFGL